MTSSRIPPDDRETVIPLYEETLSVAKRAVERGRVRIDVRVEEREQVLEQVLERHDVEVEHVPVNRVIESVPETRQEGDVLIIPIVEEEVVLVRRLVLREELHVRRQTTRRTEQFTATLRSERAEFTRDGVRNKLSDDSGDQE